MNFHSRIQIFLKYFDCLFSTVQTLTKRKRKLAPMKLHLKRRHLLLLLHRYQMKRRKLLQKNHLKQIMVCIPFKLFYFSLKLLRQVLLKKLNEINNEIQNHPLNYLSYDQKYQMLSKLHKNLKKTK